MRPLEVLVVILRLAFAVLFARLLCRISSPALGTLKMAVASRSKFACAFAPSMYSGFITLPVYGQE